MSIEEHGIVHTQIKATRGRLAEKDGLESSLKWNIAYQGERIIVYLLALAIVGLLILWATSSSALLLYGSLAGVLLLTVLWGLARIRGVERIRRQRALAAAAFAQGDTARNDASKTRP